MLILAVDVGVSGCITLLNINTLEAEFHAIPSIQYGTATGGKRRRTDDYELLNLIGSIAGPQIVFAIVEYQQAFFRGSRSSTFAIGDCFGLIRGMILSHRMQLEMVKPRDWKAAMNLIKEADDETQSQRKERSRQLALKLFPDIAPQLRRKMDHDKAESLLIAEYARRHVLRKYFPAYGSCVSEEPLKLFKFKVEKPAARMLERPSTKDARVCVE